MTSSLPLPTELNTLLTSQASLQQSLHDHKDLLSRFESLIEARRVGHGRMQLPVELGMGFSVEGVVEETKKIICSLGLQDLWVELELEKAVEFVEKKVVIIERRLAGLEEPIKKLKEDYALVAKTLRASLELPDKEDELVV